MQAHCPSNEYRIKRVAMQIASSLLGKIIYHLSFILKNYGYYLKAFVHSSCYSILFKS